MTFTLYSVTADDFCNYEYEINGLVGCTNDERLPSLLHKILNTDSSLIYSSLCSLEYAINIEYEDTEYSGTYTVTQLFSRIYTDGYDFKTHIASDIRTALPEHFI